VAFVSDEAIPIEVELANKSKPRLDAILGLHRSWITARKAAAVIYVCGDEEGCRRIDRAARRVGLLPSNGIFRIELLAAIQQQTHTKYLRFRGKSDPAA
jgi:hypothetical protein